MVNSYLLSMDEAHHRWQLRHTLYGEYSDETDVVVIEGGLAVDSLTLDFGRPPLARPDGRRAAVVVVDGDLTATDWLVDLNHDDSPALVVRGDLRASNLVGLGTAIYVDGNVDVRESIVMTNYLGLLTVGGDLHTTLLVALDHSTQIFGHLYAEMVWSQECLSVEDFDRFHSPERVGAVYNFHKGWLDRLNLPVEWEVAALRRLDPAVFSAADRELLAAPPGAEAPRVSVDLDSVVSLVKAGRPLLLHDEG